MHELVFYLSLVLAATNSTQGIIVNSIDRLVFLLTCFALCAVSIDLVFSEVWSGLRAFRWSFLTPSCIYFAVRFNNKRLSSKRILLFFTFGSLITAGIIILNWNLYQSSRNEMNISESFRLTSIGLVLFMSYSFARYHFHGFLRIIVIIILLFAIYITANRTLVISIFLLEFGSLFFRGFALLKYFKSIVLLLIITIILSWKFTLTAEPDDVILYRELQSSSSRLLSYKLLMIDLIDRLEIWRQFVSQKVTLGWLFGSGLSSINVGTLSRGAQSYGSSHNVLISLYRSTGLLGLVTFVNILSISFNYLLKNNISLNIRWSLIFILVGIFIVSLTNDLFTGFRMNYLMIALALISNESQTIYESTRE